MGRFVFSLALLAGLAYGGLYFYYGIAIKQSIQQQLDDSGMTAVEVMHIDYGPLAPISQQAEIAATVGYRGAEASLDIHLDGHPLFSDELRVRLDGLQALRLTIGGGE